MNKIYFDSDNNIEVTQEMENIKSFDEFLFEYLDTIQKLSGVMVIVEDKILLVKPVKFKELTDKWSIPKGKVEKEHSLIENAIRELEEETGIVLTTEIVQNADRTKIFYKKSGRIRELTTFVVRMNKEDLQVNINRRWTVHKKHFDTDEIFKAKFFTKQQAIEKMESGQMPLLKFM